jgi:hypothetical protein
MCKKYVVNFTLLHAPVGIEAILTFCMPESIPSMALPGEKTQRITPMNLKRRSVDESVSVNAMLQVK